MKTEKPIEILEQIFSERINVRSISKETSVTTLSTAKKNCREKNFDVHLFKVKESDDILLFKKEDNSKVSLNVNDLISDSTPVFDVLRMLQNQPYLFVKEKEKITRIVTRADWDSIPVRIFLFGTISLFEHQLRDFIENEIPSWKGNLSLGRISAAETLFGQKKENNEEVKLIECLQLCDLGAIVKKNWKIFFKIIDGFDRGVTVKKIYRLTELRNELAHSQEFSFSFNEVFELIDFATMVVKKI